MGEVTINLKWILIGIIAILIGVLAYIGYNHYSNEKEPQVVTTNIETATDPDKLQKLINQNSNANLNKYQTREVTNTITKIVERDRQPETVVTSTGKNYEKVAQKEATKRNADAVVVTPSQGETKQIEDIKDSDVVNLNQYNIQAYPKHIMSVGAYSDGDVTVDYENQIKFLGKHMYVGPSVKYNNKDHDVAMGIKATIPF